MKCTPSHEWISLQGEVGFVGITSHAQKELGEIVYLELPTVGDHVEMGEEVVVLESTKAAADIYSPVSGTVIAVNDQLKESLDSLNQSPEKEGWLFQIQPSSPKEFDDLLSKEDYEALFR